MEDNEETQISVALFACTVVMNVEKRENTPAASELNERSRRL